MYNVFILGIISFLTDVSTEMVYPLIPIFLTTTLGATPAIVGIIEEMAESLASLLKVFSGHWGDKTKKKKELAIAGYGSSMLGKGFLLIANSWGIILIARVVDRLGKGIRTGLRDAIIADSAEVQSRGLYRAMDSLGAVIGVTIAYFLLVGNTTDFTKIFLISLIPALLGVIALFWVRQPKEIKPTGQKLTFSWRGLDGKLKAFLILPFVFTLGNSSNQFLLL